MKINIVVYCTESKKNTDQTCGTFSPSDDAALTPVYVDTVLQEEAGAVGFIVGEPGAVFGAVTQVQAGVAGRGVAVKAHLVAKTP